MKEFDLGDISADFIKGYNACLEDFENALPKSTEATCMDMLNAFIASLYLGKETVKALQEMQLTQENCCKLCQKWFFNSN